MVSSPRILSKTEFSLISTSLKSTLYCTIVRHIWENLPKVDEYGGQTILLGAMEYHWKDLIQTFDLRQSPVWGVLICTLKLA